MLKREVAVELMKHLVTCSSHGYSQTYREGDTTGNMCPVDVGGKIYYLRTGDRDCSSAILDAYRTAGISCDAANTTADMYNCMYNNTTNFSWHSIEKNYAVKPGDIYLNHENHAAMCLSVNPTMLMEFCIAETGDITGVSGDQTGQESRIRPYYNYPWDGILECINNEQVESINATIQPNTGAEYQRLSYVPAGNGYYRLWNKATGYYLTALYPGNGGNVDFRPENGNDTQLWKEIKKKDSHADYTLYSPKANLNVYLSVENNGMNGSTNLKLWESLNNMKQYFWPREETRDNKTLIIHTYTGKCISSHD